MNLQSIYNGQCWQQKEFPCFKVMVLMLDHENGELMFCKVGFESGETPLLMSEEDGMWKYTESDLLKQLKARKYTQIGRGEIVVKQEKQ